MVTTIVADEEFLKQKCKKEEGGCALYYTDDGITAYRHPECEPACKPTSCVETECSQQNGKWYCEQACELRNTEEFRQKRSKKCKEYMEICLFGVGNCSDKQYLMSKRECENTKKDLKTKCKQEWMCDLHPLCKKACNPKYCTDDNCPENTATRAWYCEQACKLKAN